MSWRETMGVTEPVGKSHTHNPYNAQKTSEPTNSAYIADFALPDSTEDDSKLLEELATACSGLPISPAEVREALADEGIEDWRRGDLDTGTLTVFATCLVERRMMDQGEVPSHYAYTASCQHCGPVWLWFSGEVLGCPWCWNRAAERPIPRPYRVRCSDCVHFQRINHPHLGHCAKGKPEAIAGQWDSDQHYCQQYLPKPNTPNQDTSSINKKSK